MWGILFVTQDIYGDRHEALIIEMRLYWSEIEQSGLNIVVVILNAPSLLSGFLCYHGYTLAGAQQAPLWEGLWRQGCSREEEGLTWELYHFNFLVKSTFFLKTPDCSFDLMSLCWSYNSQGYMGFNKSYCCYTMYETKNWLLKEIIKYKKVSNYL